MITNRDILVFSDDWGKLPSTLQHITKVLKNGNRIFWIGSLGLRKPKFTFYDFKRAGTKIYSMLFRDNAAKEESINDYSPVQIFPFVLPFHNNSIVRKLNTFSLQSKILSVFKKYNAANPILLTSSPVIDEVIGKLGESSSHYFCLDEYALFENAFEEIPRLENELVKKVDSVFSISEKLQISRIPSSGNSYFIPQGAEIAHFVKTKNLPQEVSSLKHPVIGFFGLISEWIDLDLVEKCVLAYPDYTFLFLGKNVVSIERLKEKNNFMHLGEIPYKKLPKFASVFDVALIPFKINELTLAVNPLKLIEYLSLGLPVISTNMPEVKKFEPLVYIGETEEQFINSIKISIDENSNILFNRRIEKSKEYSWQTITENISNRILDIESKKKK